MSVFWQLKVFIRLNIYWSGTHNSRHQSFFFLGAPDCRLKSEWKCKFRLPQVHYQLIKCLFLIKCNICNKTKANEPNLQGYQNDTNLANEDSQPQATYDVVRNKTIIEQDGIIMYIFKTKQKKKQKQKSKTKQYRYLVFENIGFHKTFCRFPILREYLISLNFGV